MIPRAWSSSTGQKGFENKELEKKDSFFPNVTVSREEELVAAVNQS